MAAWSGGRVARVAEAHVDDVGAVVDGPHDALDDVAVLAEAVGVEDGDGHDLDARVADAGDALAVVGPGRDDAGHGRAVAVRVGRAGGAVEDRGARRRAGRRGRDARRRRRCRGARRPREPDGVDGAEDRCPSRSSAATTGRRSTVSDGAASASRTRSSSTLDDGAVGAEVGDDARAVGDGDRRHAQRGDRARDRGADGREGVGGGLARMSRVRTGRRSRSSRGSRSVRALRRGRVRRSARPLARRSDPAPPSVRRSGPVRESAPRSGPARRRLGGRRGRRLRRCRRLGRRCRARIGRRVGLGCGHGRDRQQ